MWRTTKRLMTARAKLLSRRPRILIIIIIIIIISTSEVSGDHEVTTKLLLGGELLAERYRTDDGHGRPNGAIQLYYYCYYYHHHHRPTPLDSTQLNIDATSSPEPPGSLQLSPVHTPDTGTPTDENHAHFRRFPPTDNPHPVASPHAQHNYVINCGSCETETGVLQSAENFSEERSCFEHALEIDNEDGSTSQTYCGTAAAAAPPSSSFLSLLSGLHKPQQMMRSLGHVLSDVINVRWIRRQRVPSAIDDQSAAGDVARDDVDLTSLLPTA